MTAVQVISKKDVILNFPFNNTKSDQVRISIYHGGKNLQKTWKRWSDGNYK